VSRLRLYLDEDQPRDLASILRERGIDTLEPSETGLRAAPDLVQFEFAAREGRALATSNARDFAVIALEQLTAGKIHPGLVFTTQEPLSVLLKRLIRLAAAESAESMVSRIVWLNAYR
jgi:predicted nuclease of predicted toxin-antitoxin system